MTAIVYERPDGGVSILRLVPLEKVRGPALDRFSEWLLTRVPGPVPVETLGQHWLDYIMDKDVPRDAMNARVVDDADIPTDRTFRDALTVRLDYDMAKARDIWRDKIRVARAPKLATLDIEYQRADEAADAKAKVDIATAKQALRDATADPAIEAAATCAELKAVWPAALKD